MKVVFRMRQLMLLIIIQVFKSGVFLLRLFGTTWRTIMLKLKFRNILSVDEDTQSLVRTWRNSESERMFSYDDHYISEDEHSNWLRSLQNNEKHVLYVVFFNDLPIGTVSLSNIRLKHKTADWAFGLAEEKLRGKGVAGIMEYQLLEHAFGEFGLEKLNCEVFSTNEKVIRLHKKFGFKVEGIRRNNIIKGNERLDVILLGILSREWEEKREKLGKILERVKI
ncbi:MAG: UDP-4-amino-4,6-dideoxy-N-acetyl-beta-L-altrosamine N-acetyltransferase [Candidatus Parabeggiatoa sp. nov. 2]|nr:MAG: UDP-4-amino-4,6-dideoxy-N-acetyl-beta-L-altrosamine N-acetyltransferase [Beggiatoa sp. 4572_84]